MRYQLGTLLALTAAAAVYFAISRSTGYWAGAGLVFAISIVVAAIRSKKRGYFLIARWTAGLVALATTWLLAVDWSEFVEICPDCHSGKFIGHYRILGLPVSTEVREARTKVDLALADLGAPCNHDSLERTQTHRWWGLLICGYPCEDGTWLFGGDDGYTPFVSARVQAMGKADPAFAAELRRRVIDNDDKSYFWDAFMTDRLAPEWIIAPNTREALSWLQGTSEADYRSLSIGQSNEESIAWVQEAYNAGAEKVFAVEIEPYEWNQTRSVENVLIKLPTDATLRSQVFGWLGRQYKKPSDLPQDYGQSYIDY